MGLGSIFKGIGKGLLNVGTGGISGAIGDLLGAGGAGIAGASASAANNRGNQFEGQIGLAKLLADRDQAQQQLNLNADNSFTSNAIARQKSGDDSAQNAWRKLLSAQHTLSPGMAPQNAGPYNMAQRMPTDAERTGAEALSGEVMGRLQGGNPIAPVERTNVNLGYDPLSTIEPNLLKAGTGEKLGGWLAPILTYLGQQKNKEASA